MYFFPLFYFIFFFYSGNLQPSASTIMQKITHPHSYEVLQLFHGQNTELSKSLVFHCRKYYFKSMFEIRDVRFLEQQPRVLNPCMSPWVSV